MRKMVHIEKYKELTQILEGMGSVAVAFSGGVDSSLMIYVAHKILKNRAKAYTINTPYIANWELNEAKEFCSNYKIPLQILELPIDKTLTMLSDSGQIELYPTTNLEFGKMFGEKVLQSITALQIKRTIFGI
jgi:tRNA(Ile)-lysidine synthase TilS/MesJ